MESHLGLATDHRVVAIALAPSFVVDSRLLPREPNPDRTYLYVLLEGELVLQASRRRVSGPAVVVGESRNAFHVGEHLRQLAPNRALAFQLDRNLLDHRGPAAVAALPDDARAAGEALHEALRTPAPFAALAAAESALFAALRAGTPFATNTPILTAPKARHERFAESLGRALALTGERPAQVDLADEEVGSERTSRRLYAEIATHYGWTYERWQALRRQWSTVVACILLTLPGARPADVARKVGFASLTSLHHALERAGMPPPRELQTMAARVTEQSAAADLVDAIAKIGHAPDSAP